MLFIHFLVLMLFINNLIFNMYKLDIVYIMLHLYFTKGNYDDMNVNDNYRTILFNLIMYQVNLKLLNHIEYLKYCYN